MSGLLKITFGSDMTTSALDVVSPDLEILDRIMLAPGAEAEVEVTSEASFLRLHLPSGKTVILKDPGNLNRVISRKTVRDALRRTYPNDYQSEALVEFANDQEDTRLKRRVVRSASPPRVELRDVVDLGRYGDVRLVSSGGQGIPGRAVNRGARWKLSPHPLEAPLSMTIAHPSGSILSVRLPHDVTNIRLNTKRSVEHGITTTFTISLTTAEPAADAILSYLQRGDLYAAQAMAPWVERAKEMLYYKTENAYAAAVGAYLLLRLRMFSQLHDWPKNLADMFKFLPDACVIWAWLLIYQKPMEKNEIARYLFMAADRGIPVYSEGLRLLTDGLRLLGPDAQPILDKLIQQAGAIVPHSPISALLNHSAQSITNRIAISIGFP